MSPKKSIKLNKLHRIALAVAVITLGLCLEGACLYIAASGSGFSREAVARAFRGISVPVSLCVALILSGLLLRPRQQTPRSPSRQPQAPSVGSRQLQWLRICVAVLAVGLALYGFLSGGAVDVLTKAANICSECIGLG